VTLRYLRHTSDAEDAAQEALLAAYRGLGAFRGDCSFPTWLHRIAINAAKNALLARSRAANVVSLESLVSQSPDGAGAAAALRELETPETLSLSDDVSSAVDAALRALPRGHREAIVLREMDGLAYWQIAVALAIPMGTVRSRVFRAREFIDRQLRCVCDGGLGRGSRPLAPEIRRF
jgi:RNA polymerase sigma-70 factor (ECF subfamily)